MKKGLHPENYRMVAFKDMSNDQVFLVKSTVNTRETITIEGVEYPLYKLEISSASHPFYTGKMKLVDTAGRVDKFMSRYKKHMENKQKEFLREGQTKGLGATINSGSTEAFLCFSNRAGGYILTRMKPLQKYRAGSMFYRGFSPSSLRLRY